MPRPYFVRTVLLILPFLHGSILAQEYPIVGGTVLDAETMQPIPNVYIIINNGRAVAATDGGGYFELRLGEAVYLLEFRHVAYRSRFDPLHLAKRQGQMLLIELKPRLIELPEVAVIETVKRLLRLDERNTYAVIRSEQIQESRAANLVEVLLQLAPTAGAMYSTAEIGPNQLPPLLYINGIRTESWVVELINVQTIDRVLIWRTVEAPITYRAEMPRYLIDIRTKLK